MGVQSEARDALDRPPGESGWSGLWIHGELLSPAQCPMVDADSGCQKVLPGRWSQLTRCLSCEILEASTHLMFPGLQGLCFMAELILLTLPQRRWNNDLGPAGFEDKRWLTNCQVQRFVRVRQGSLCLRSTSEYWYCRAVFHLNKMLSGLELCSGEAFALGGKI